MEQNPFFSVITVSYNSGDGVRRAAEALRNQTCGDYEHIIKDGGSVDGSVEALGDLTACDPRIRLTVSKDSGIYDAMNQALTQARGRFIFFLNCGDSFIDDDVLSDVRNRIENDVISSENAVIYGDFMLRGERVRQPECLKSWYLYRRPLNHQSMFFGRDVFEKYGCFDTDFKIRADHELTLRTFRGGATFYRVDRVISEYEGGGFSEKAENQAVSREELERIRDRYFTSDEVKRYRFRERLLFGTVRNRIRRGSSLKIRRIYRAFANWFNR